MLRSVVVQVSPASVQGPFHFFLVRDAYSLKWSSDVCEYSPTSIK
jgi:hypothetical protein